MRARAGALAVAVMAMGAVAWAQEAPTTPVDLVPSTEIATTGKAQLEAARKTASGSAGVTLAKYPGHYTMVSARSKSGGAEVHGNWSDFLIVVDGEGEELTGGTVVDAKPGDAGEIRGTRLEGATRHPLHKGDVIHIPAGTPHQAIEAPGQTITLYVIKVEKPKS